MQSIWVAETRRGCIDPDPVFQPKKVIAGLGGLAALASLVGCERPTRDPAKLEAIKVESQRLMSTYQAGAAVPGARWPGTIASLEPEFVWVMPDGVHVTTRAYFDGGWGYFVPRNQRHRPQPAGRFEEVAQGVYWWHPC